jgi:hypothetical protein
MRWPDSAAMRPALASLLLVLGLALLAVAPAADAGGGKNHFATELTIDYDSGALLGRVKSKVNRCKIGRRVFLYHREVEGEEAELAGSDRADETGRWSVRPDPLTGGDYWAVAKRKVKGNSVCGKDRSETLRLTR